MIYEIDLGSKCNLHCNYCYHKGLSGSLSNITKYLPKESVRVHLLGGEPLLYWDIIETLPKQHEYSLTTNLTILDKKKESYLREHKFGIIGSIDGLERVHNRQRDNSYKMVIQNALRIKDYIKLIRMTVEPESIKYMLSGIISLYQLGFKRIRAVLNGYRTDYDWDAVEYGLGKVHIWELNRGIKVYEYPRSCKAGQTITCLGYDGKIYPCHRFVGTDITFINPSASGCYHLNYIESGDINKLSRHQERLREIKCKHMSLISLHQRP